MNKGPESGYSPAKKNLLGQLLSLPKEARRFANRQYYLWATTEPQRQEAFVRAERFAREATFFLTRPDILPSLSLNPYEEGALATIAGALSENKLIRGEPEYLRLEWSSPGFFRGVAGLDDRFISAFHYTWDTGLQYPVDFSFSGIDKEKPLPVSAHFVVMPCKADELEPDPKNKFTVTPGGGWIETNEPVRRGGQNMRRMEEYRYVGSFEDSEGAMAPYFIYMRKRQIFVPSAQRQPAPLIVRPAPGGV